jgi:hypothetical protein
MEDFLVEAVHSGALSCCGTWSMEICGLKSTPAIQMQILFLNDLRQQNSTKGTTTDFLKAAEAA